MHKEKNNQWHPRTTRLNLDYVHLLKGNMPAENE